MKMKKRKLGVDKQELNLIEGWLAKATNDLHTGREHLKATRWSESVQAFQECIEFSVKSILRLLEVEFPYSHKWGETQIAEIATQIRTKQILERPEVKYMGLPRLLFIVNFWGGLYILSKYGFEAGALAPARDLIRGEEAKLAEQHANECWLAASQLLGQITYLLSVQKTG
jgi:HEPN domain-containing protein